MMNLSLRPATLADVDLLRHWDERLGSRFAESRRFGDDDCCVYRMSREQYASSSAKESA